MSIKQRKGEIRKKEVLADKSNLYGKTEKRNMNNSSICHMQYEILNINLRITMRMKSVNIKCFPEPFDNLRVNRSAFTAHELNRMVHEIMDLPFHLEVRICLPSTRNNPFNSLSVDSSALTLHTLNRMVHKLMNVPFLLHVRVCLPSIRNSQFNSLNVNSSVLTLNELNRIVHKIMHIPFLFQVRI